MDTLEDKWREWHRQMPDIHQEEFSPDGLAHLIGIPREIILHAVVTGELKAERLGHHTVCLRREDVLDWLQRRGGV